MRMYNIIVNILISNLTAIVSSNIIAQPLPPSTQLAVSDLPATTALRFPSTVMTKLLEPKGH